MHAMRFDAHVMSELEHESKNDFMIHKLSDELPKISAWRRVESQRAAQEVQEEARERVLSALKAVGASSPTLRQARKAMVAQASQE